MERRAAGWSDRKRPRKAAENYGICTKAILFQLETQAASVTVTTVTVTIVKSDSFFGPEKDLLIKVTGDHPVV